MVPCGTMWYHVVLSWQACIVTCLALHLVRRTAPPRASIPGIHSKSVQLAVARCSELPGPRSSTPTDRPKHPLVPWVWPSPCSWAI